MMDFEKFVENILKEIRMRANGRFQIRRHDVTKNNNVKRTGIAVVEGEAYIEPCIYLDDFFEEYESGGIPFDAIVDEVYRLILMRKKDVSRIDISGFLNWETVRKNIYAKLINAEQNKEMLEKIPHRIFMDLAVVYYAVAGRHAQEIGTILIRNEHMEKWGQEEENLYHTALMNMRADGEADFTPIETVIKHIMTDTAFQNEHSGISCDTSMFILTNRRKHFGAAEILDKKTLRMVADKIGDGFIVLPSSVHETIVLPPKDESDYKMLADMVKEVNTTQVDVEERLSDHVYVYNRTEEVLKVVA